MSKKDSDSEEGAPPPGDLNDAALVREFFEHRERVANVLAEHTERFFNLRDEVNQRLTAHEAAVGEKIASRLRVYGWGGALAVAGGILAILLGYWRAEREFHDAFRARLDDEFAAPKVQAAIQDAARREAESVARQELRPQVEEAVRLVEEVKSGTERAIEPLLKVQRVVELQGRAGAMSRSAYEELGRLSEQASDPEVKVLASGAFLGIRAAHSFSRFREDLPFEVKGPDGVSLKNADIPDQDLLRLLGEGNDFERGMAATWLARKQNRCAVPALMRLLAHDGEPHLIALRHEIEAVRQLVPGIPAAGSSFDVDAVLGWWDVHSSDFSPCATSVEPPVDLSWLSGG